MAPETRVFAPQCWIEFCGLRVPLSAEFLGEAEVQRALLRSLARSVGESDAEVGAKTRFLAMLSELLERDGARDASAVPRQEAAAQARANAARPSKKQRDSK